MSKKKKLTLLLIAVLVVAVTGFTFAAQYATADHTKKSFFEYSWYFISTDG